MNTTCGGQRIFGTYRFERFTILKAPGSAGGCITYTRKIHSTLKSAHLVNNSKAFAAAWAQQNIRKSFSQQFFLSTPGNICYTFGVLW
jgi:hypothetical protein